MHTMILQWKEFNVSLPNLDAHLRATYPACTGCSGNSKLEIHFSEEPSSEEKQDIQDHYDALDGSDYKSAEDLAAEEAELAEAIADAKLAMISKAWDELSAVEKKLAMNLAVTREEMGL